MRKLAFVSVLIAALAAPVVAQAQTAPPTSTPPPSAVTAVPPPGTLPPAVVQQTQTPPPPPPPTVAPGRGGRGQMTPPPTQNMNVAVTRGPWQPPAQNIRVELTIGDSAGKGGKKAVSMLLADGHSGRIRSSGTGTLNVDGTARTGSVADGRILLDLTIEYVPDRQAMIAGLNQSISVVVNNGQSTLLSRSADPASDRSVTVEVTATIVK